jgi:diguanylate cyclase (GGDEF)-like protein
MDARAGTWLCRSEIERARVVDNGARVTRARTIATASVGATLLLFAPMFGWWTLLLFALAALNTQTVDRRIARSMHPERHVAFSIFWSQLILAAAVTLSGGPKSPAMPWLVVPTAFAATRFRREVVTAAVASAVVMLFAATFVVAPTETMAHPASLVVSIALLVSITAVVAALSGAEVEQRTESVLDPLTGLLNRAALHRRFDELEQQAHLTGDELSLLVCDIDRFKAVNDTHGHDRGDAVLRDVAYEMRKQLRSFELIYRLGGEEFVLVLPGARDGDARRIAERLRESLGAARPGGLSVTVSIGVSSARGEQVVFDSLFKEADRALYVAKANGRDRVVSATDVAALDAEALGSERAGISAQAPAARVVS